MISSSSFLSFSTVECSPSHPISPLSYSILSLSSGTLSFSHAVFDSLSFALGVVPLSLFSSTTATFERCYFHSISLFNSFLTITVDAHYSLHSNQLATLTIHQSNITSLILDRRQSHPFFFSTSPPTGRTITITSSAFAACASSGCTEGGAVSYVYPPRGCGSQAIRGTSISSSTGTRQGTFFDVNAVLQHRSKISAEK